MANVDDLFSGGAKAPPIADNLARIWRFLVFATPLNLFGFACFTSVPGAFLTLWAWQLAEEEVARVESGALPAERGASVRAARGYAFGMLVFVCFSLLGQIVLYSLGLYDAYAQVLLQLVGWGAPS
jgi:hypothetical protein